MENTNTLFEPPLSQTFLVCIAKNNGLKVRIDGAKVFAARPMINTFTNERWEEETEISNFTRKQITEFIG